MFSYDKLDLIWPLCANEVIKAELDQMERISVKWSESQYLPSLPPSLLPASFEQLHGGGREERKRSSRDRQILLRLQRRAIVLKKLARIKISVAFFLSSWFIGIWPAIQPSEKVPNLSHFLNGTSKISVRLFSWTSSLYLTNLCKYQLVPNFSASSTS